MNTDNPILRVSRPSWLEAQRQTAQRYRRLLSPVPMQFLEPGSLPSLDQSPGSVPTGGQGVALPAVTIQGQHQQLVELLAERISTGLGPMALS